MSLNLIASNPRSSRCRAAAIVQAGALVLALVCGAAKAEDDEDGSAAARLRHYISEQVGGLHNLEVPARNEDIPVPPDDPTRLGRYRTTEAKRFLGKMLFHDPVRSARIDKNTGQPKDLPQGTSFGGTLNATDPLIQKMFPEASNVTSSEIQKLINAQKLGTSCGSCHIGEAAAKAGQQINFASGGEGRGYTDEQGNFFPRRRPQSILVKLRAQPIFPGDALVDALPTLTDIWVDHGTDVITTPAYFYHYPNPPGALNPPAASADPNLQLLATGRLDQLDSVSRLSMPLVGFAFNNRLLFGGIGGEPQSTPGSLNPFNDPAQENMTLLLLDAHRMLNFQSIELRKIPAFVKLFQDAFPEVDPNNLTALVNDDTEFRAQATFLRTVVTRNTAFDRFLAGDDHALTAKQRRGARLFFTPATGGSGGAGCFGCHSGPNLNKQPNDPDVAGIGAFVEENFFNVGIGDHPIQALNALARGHLDPRKLGTDGFPYHAEDTGRQETTHNPADAFKFRSLTLRQLRDGRNFFHNASFTKVEDVVQYFNAGIPQDATAGGAPTLSARFTNPRGPGYPRGLGLTEHEVDEITDFLENALYDPAFVHFDPNSSTDTFQPNVRDLTYSKYRPDLAALGAKDGFMPSGLAIDDNDPLARRDEGLEFLDVTSLTTISRIDPDREDHERHAVDAYRIANISKSIIDTHLLVIVEGLSSGVRLVNASGTTKSGDPYRRIFLPDGTLQPGQSIVVKLRFDAPARYSLTLLSGQGKP